MPIIVEDGSNVANANSYVDVVALEAYALERGASLPAAEEDKEILLIKAMDYLDLFTGRLVGAPTYPDQTLPFPRTDYYGDLSVPKEVREAQMIAAIVAKDIDLTPVVTATRQATMQKVGPITVSYAGSSRQPTRPAIPLVSSKMRQFIRSAASVTVLRA